MNVGWRLGWADLRSRRGLAISLTLLIAVPLFAALLLDGYGRSIAKIERRVRPLLVVQAANTPGEIAGSRIPSDVRERLLDLGVTDAVPEVHAITGERVDRGLLLRGVELDRYRDIETFDLVAGRSLEVGDGPRTAMIGVRLAERRGIGIGGTVDVRGRRFAVVGVFSIGTFADNEVWIPIGAAQDVLGWGRDVSLFVIPDEGVLQPGDHLPGALAVGRRGDVDVFADEWLPLLALVGTAAWALEVGAAVVLAIVLWRVAWLRRRELGLFRLLGLRRAAGAYLLAHGLAIAVASVAIAVVAAITFSRAIATETLGVPVESNVDLVVIARTVGAGAMVLALGVLAPVLVLQRRRPARLLQRN